MKPVQVEHRLCEFSLELRPESLARWLIARDDRLAALPIAGTPVPMSYFVFLRAQPVLGVSFHDLLERDPDRGLYGGVKYTAIRSPRVGETLTVACEVVDRRVVESSKGDLRLTSLRTLYSAGEDPVLEEVVQMVDLPAQSAPEKEVPPGEKSASDSPPEGFARVSHMEPMSRRQIAWLTVESGDFNPLHVDVKYANRRGFSDVVVPAPLLVALVERELLKHAGAEAAVALSARFQAPTFPDEPLELFAAESGGEWNFELHGGNAIRARGRVTL